MKILVTGGAGFIGSHVVDACIEAGHEVVIFDNLSTGTKENINPKAKFYPLDIRSPEAMETFVKEAPDILNHHAAQIRIDISVKDPVLDLDINTVSLIKLLQAAKESHFLKKVVFASTGGAMYGNKTTPFVETMTAQPLSPYGVSKRCSELYLNYYQEQYGIKYTALRYANVYGPRQNPHGEAGVISILCERLLTGQQPIINGDGTQTRDYVFVADIVKANMLAIDKEVNGELNIGTSIETDVNEIYRLVSQEINPQIKAQHGPARPGEQITSSLNYNLAQEKLGWEPTVKLQEGIKQTVEFFKQKSVAKS